MKSLLMALLVFMTIPAWGQTAPQPDIQIVSDGSLLRGKITNFSVTISANVQRLSSLILNLGLHYPTTGGLSNLALAFVSPLGSQSLQPGELLTQQTPTLAFQAVQTAPPPDIPVFEEIFQVAGGNYTVNFASPVSGPGELFKFSVFTPIAVSPKVTAKSFDLTTPFITLKSAQDDQGNPLALTVGPIDVKGDVRLFGDVNGDGRVTTANVILTLQSVVGLYPLSDIQSWYADVQPCSLTGNAQSNDRFLGDGSITSGDAIMMLRVITRTFQDWWPDPIP